MLLTLPAKMDLAEVFCFCISGIQLTFANIAYFAGGKVAPQRVRAVREMAEGERKRLKDLEKQRDKLGGEADYILDLVCLDCACACTYVRFVVCASFVFLGFQWWEKGRLGKVLEMRMVVERRGTGGNGMGVLECFSCT